MRTFPVLGLGSLSNPRCSNSFKNLVTLGVSTAYLYLPSPLHGEPSTTDRLVFTLQCHVLTMGLIFYMFSVGFHLC